MVTNIGSLDRMLRLALGAALLAWTIFGSGPERWWGLIGIVPLLTALVRFCPLYRLIGVRTSGQ